MKKILKILIVMALALLSLSGFGHQAFAEDAKDPLFSDLVYDKDAHILTGKTVPNANISLADIVATITADEEGNFSVPIPEDLKKTTITIMDFLNDQSTDINYDFLTGTIDTTEEHVESQSPATSVSQSSSSSSSAPTQVSTDKPTTTEPPQNESSVLIWVVVLVVIVILTILAIFLVNKRKAEKQQAELAQIEKSRSGRRKRRKKTPK